MNGAGGRGQSRINLALWLGPRCPVNCPLWVYHMGMCVCERGACELSTMGCLCRAMSYIGSALWVPGPCPLDLWWI